MNRRYTGHVTQTTILPTRSKEYPAGDFSDIMNAHFIGALGTSSASRHFILAWLLFGILSYTNRIQAQLQWEQIYPVAGLETMNDVAFNGASFIAVGDQGRIITSTDGTNWVQLYADRNTTFHGVARNRNLTVAIGSGRTVWSDDGKIWRPSSGAESVINQSDVAFGNNHFVSVGDDIAYALSPGNWSRSEFTPANRLHSVAFGGGLFVAVGEGGLTLTSTNGVEWAVAPHGFSSDLHAVTYSTNRYVAVGDNGTILISENGRDWSRSQISAAESFRKVAYGNGRFVVASADQILTSPDAHHWTEASATGLQGIRGLTYAFGRPLTERFLTWGSATNGTFISTNGLDWQKVIRPGITNPTGIAQNPFGHLLVTGAGGSVLLSTNQGSWNLHRLWGFTNFNTVTAYGSTYIGLDRSGKISFSGNGTNWQSSYTPAGNAYPLNKLITGPFQKAYAVGDRGKIVYHALANLQSPNTPWGETWGITLNRLIDLAGNTNLLAAIAEKEIISTTDGMNWISALTIHSHQTLRGIVYGMDRLLAVGEEAGLGGMMMTSTNGLDWIVTSLPHLPPLLDVAYSNGRFLAISSHAIHESLDGLTWTSSEPFTTGGLRLIEFLPNISGTYKNNKNGFVILSDDGTIFRSEPVYPRLNIVNRSASGRISVLLHSERNARFRVMMTEDFLDWVVIKEIQNLPGPDFDLELSTRIGKQKFFRIVYD